jgi:hypothetical protein
MAFTAISWNKVASDTSSVSITIPTGYYDMRLKYSIKGTSASEQNILFTANSVTSGYLSAFSHSNGAALTRVSLGSSLNSSAAAGLLGVCPGADAGKPWLAFVGILDIPVYRETGKRKNYLCRGAYENTVADTAVKVGQGVILTTTASTTTSIQIFLGAGNIKAGSTFALYGATKYGA